MNNESKSIKLTIMNNEMTKFALMKGKVQKCLNNE